MPNMDPKKTPMPSQEPQIRNANFEEVALGYTAEMAVSEAKRCLNCKNKPCVSACPVCIDIPAFIQQVANENFEAAYEVLSQSTSLPAVCGSVQFLFAACWGYRRSILNKHGTYGRHHKSRKAPQYP